MNQPLRKILYISFILIITLTCGKPSDKQAYEEVLGTLSAEKVKNFFNTYPNSPYAEQLVDDLVILCSRDKSDQCCGMILQTISEKHIRYNEFKALCDKKKIKNKI